MATKKQGQPKKVKEAPPEFWIGPELQEVFVSPKYVYEVEVFKFGKNSYNLEDSKYIQTTTFEKNSVEYFKKEGIQYWKRVTLIGAPKSWLDKNKFNLKT